MNYKGYTFLKTIQLEKGTADLFEAPDGQYVFDMGDFSITYSDLKKMLKEYNIEGDE